MHVEFTYLVIWHNDHVNLLAAEWLDNVHITYICVSHVTSSFSFIHIAASSVSYLQINNVTLPVTVAYNMAQKYKITEMDTA